MFSATTFDEVAFLWHCYRLSKSKHGCTGVRSCIEYCSRNTDQVARFHSYRTHKEGLHQHEFTR
jgi:hypothetical protein